LRGRIGRKTDSARRPWPFLVCEPPRVDLWRFLFWLKESV
jgi:hypothetical protein